MTWEPAAIKQFYYHLWRHRRYRQTKLPNLLSAACLCRAGPLRWWKAVCDTTRSVLKQSKVKPQDVVGMTFSSQVQNLISLDQSGTPLMRSMSWLDGRSADVVRERLWTPPRLLGYNIFHLLRFLTITGGSPGHTGKDQIGKNAMAARASARFVLKNL